MKSHVWDTTSGSQRPRRSKKLPRRRSVAAILKAAYRRHVRDRLTRAAVKRYLP